MKTTNYSQEAISVVEECIEMFDVESLTDYVSDLTDLDDHGIIWEKSF